MGNIASINFKPTNAIQLEHNDRTRPPTYLLVDKGLGTECTLNAKEALAKREQLIAQAKATYEKKFNQPFKATDYLYSAVVNLKETTTMADLEKLSQHFKAHYGFQCYQIAIHRDEGHIDKSTGQTCINHHAHMEFVMLHPKTGKSLMRKISKDGEPFKSKRKAYEQIQTEVAEILGMERGQFKNNQYDDEGNLITKGTYRKRIEPRAYARLMQEQADPLRAQIAQLKATQAQEHQALNAICQQIAPQPQLLSFNECKQIIEPKVQEWIALNKALGDAKLYTKEDYTALRALKQEGITPDELKAKIANLEQQIKDRTQKTQRLEQQNQALEQQAQERQALLDRQAPSSQDRKFLNTRTKEKLIDLCISYDNQRILHQLEWQRNQEIINMLIARIEQNEQIVQEILDYLKKQQENSLTQPKKQIPSSFLGAILKFLISKISELLGWEVIHPISMQSAQSAHATEQAKRAFEHDLHTQVKSLIQENQEIRKEKNKALEETRTLKRQLKASVQEPQKSSTRSKKP